MKTEPIMETELTIVRTKRSHIPPDQQIAEDATGVLFFSKETDDMFILSALLKGFKKDRIKVGQSKTKPHVSISGDRPVQEKMRWTVHKKMERTSFRKVFLIPNGVDKLRAKFNEKEEILSIFMTKSVPGIQGVAIKEVKEGVDEAESSETVRTPPVVTAEAAQSIEPKLKESEIAQSQDVTGETMSKLPESKANKISETTTPRDSIKILAKAATDPKAEANEVVKEPQVIQHQQPSKLPEDVIGKNSTQVPDRTAAGPERRAIKPMKAHPEDIRHEKPSALPADIVQLHSSQVSAKITADSDQQASDQIKAHPREIQREQPLELPEDITKAYSTQVLDNTATNPETEAIQQMKANPQEIQNEQPLALPEGITRGDSKQVSAKTTINTETEARQKMKSHPEEIRKEPTAPEDISEADSADGPAKTTSHPETDATEPTEAHSKGNQDEQPSAVTNNTSKVDSGKIPAVEPKKAHAEEIQQEPFALTEEISKVKSMIQDQKVKEPSNGEVDQAVQLKPHDAPPINETQNADRQRKEYTDEEAEITVPAEQSRKQDEILQDGSTGSEKLQGEDRVTEAQEGKEDKRDGKSLLCNSCIFAGSAVIGIIIVFVYQLMRKDNNSKK